ncbi:MAG: hypothetical protein ACFB50_08630 [Rubrobacteraceae bacterium]
MTSMEGRKVSAPDYAPPPGLLERIYAGAARRDAEPAFPREPFGELGRIGILGAPVPDPISSGGRRSSFAEEWQTLRMVTKADSSVGRILDGHFNSVERVSVLAPEPLRSRELEAVAAGELLIGLWGGNPLPGEGEPARIVDSGDGLVVDGVKTFCSGATGVDRAVVILPGTDTGPPVMVYVAISENLEIDRTWYRASGMRASESHRVVFHEVPVLAILGEPGELVKEPYYSRDATRTAVTWAGMADRAVDGALETLAAKSGGEPDDIVALAAGKMLTAQQTMDRWIEHAAGHADADPEASMIGFSTSLRESIAASCREILDEGARACGSHPFATAADLDRARRDLEVLLLQHRLEPALVHAGGQAIRSRSRGS